MEDLVGPIIIAIGVAIGLWLLLVVVAFGAVSVVPMQRMSEKDERIGESGRAAQLIADANLR